MRTLDNYTKDLEDNKKYVAEVLKGAADAVEDYIEKCKKAGVPKNFEEMFEKDWRPLSNKEKDALQKALKIYFSELLKEVSKFKEKVDDKVENDKNRGTVGAYFAWCVGELCKKNFHRDWQFTDRYVTIGDSMSIYILMEQLKDRMQKAGLPTYTITAKDEVHESPISLLKRAFREEIGSSNRAKTDIGTVVVSNNSYMDNDLFELQVRLKFMPNAAMRRAE